MQENLIKKAKNLHLSLSWVPVQSHESCQKEAPLTFAEKKYCFTPNSASEISTALKADLPLCPLKASPTPEDALALSLENLSRIHNCDPLSNTLTVDSGLSLEQALNQALNQDRFLPIALWANCLKDGGETSLFTLLSSFKNREIISPFYGSLYSHILGLEVVLGTGDLWHGLKQLRKDNSSYKLKYLFLGTDSQLGLITALSLKMTPLPRFEIKVTVQMPFLEPSTEKETLEAKTRIPSPEQVLISKLEQKTNRSCALISKTTSSDSKTESSFQTLQILFHGQENPEALQNQISSFFKTEQQAILLDNSIDPVSTSYKLPKASYHRKESTVNISDKAPKTKTTEEQFFESLKKELDPFFLLKK